MAKNTLICYCDCWACLNCVGSNNLLVVGKRVTKIFRERAALKAENEKLKDNIIEGEKVIFQLRHDLEEAVRIARECDKTTIGYDESLVCNYCRREYDECFEFPCKDRQFLSRFPVVNKKEGGNENIN